MKIHFENFKKVNLKVLNKINHSYLHKPLTIYYKSLLHEMKETLDDPNFDEVYLKVGAETVTEEPYGWRVEAVLWRHFRKAERKAMQLVQNPQEKYVEL